jgi:hypothetical protein
MKTQPITDLKLERRKIDKWRGDLHHSVIVLVFDPERETKNYVTGNLKTEHLQRRECRPAP